MAQALGKIAGPTENSSSVSTLRTPANLQSDEEALIFGSTLAANKYLSTFFMIESRINNLLRHPLAK